MKKNVLILHMTLLLFFLLGCQNDQNDGRIEMTNGSFYFASNLYDSKEINDGDILNIAYRNNYGHLYNEDGEEIAIIPEAIVPITAISQELMDMIISDYFDLVMKDEYFKDYELEISDIKLSVYCGVYNGYYALRFQDNKALVGILGGENIGGQRFIYPAMGGNTVILWKQN